MDELVALNLLANLEDAEAIHASNNPHLFNNDPLSTLTEEQFMNTFRLTKDLVRYLVDVLNPYIKPKKRSTDIDIQTKILVALRFYATGSYQGDIALNKFFNLAQSSISRCMNEVTDALNHPNIFNHFVRFPANIEELNDIRLQFFRKYEIPGVVGCIDCTHVAIVAPPSQDPQYPEHLYVNRKGYHSINVQLVCDVNKKILNVNAKYPGSTNDAFIWENSNVQSAMKNLHEKGYTDYFLLGDSGYPLRAWLLTPLEQEPQFQSPEYRYQKKHKQCRSIIECCNGILKSRFRCLLKHRTLHYSPNMAAKIVNACVVLHNLCIEHNIPDIEIDNTEFDFGIFEDEQVGVVNIARGAINAPLNEGRRKRQHIIHMCFR